MGRESRGKREARVHAPVATVAAASPNWPLLALSGVGLVLTAYLTHADHTGSTLKGCSVGSSCDIVLSSRWATLLGVPTAAWGLLVYAALGAAAFLRHAATRWRLTWMTAVVAVAYSAYLATVSLTVLHAACPYCLTSLALLTAILLLTTWQGPRPSTGLLRMRELRLLLPGVAAVLIGLHLNYTGRLGNPPAVEEATTRALALHLAASGAKMYGASWCPHCQEQKTLFGASASRLPYIECSTRGPGSPQTAECRNARITIYPTWVIDGVRREEVLSLQELAAASGFAVKPPPR